MSESLPLGVYEQLVTGRLAELLAALPPDRSANTAPPAPEELPLHLSRHLGELLHRCLHGLERSRADTGEEVGEHLARVCIELLRALDQAVGSGLARPEEYPATPPRLLLGVQADGGSELPRPLVPLGQSALLVNEPGDPSLGESLRRELASADQVDLLCAFINWNGVRLLRDVLAARTRAGVPLRVLTSTYLGVTERRAVDELCRLGAEVRVAYEREPARTRLHAKAWLLQRHSGFSTAFVGSSNLSHSALTEGLEWNVRLSSVDAPALLQRFRTTFERYWNEGVFEPYEPERDGPRLEAAAGRPDRLRDSAGAVHFFDLQPFPHQREILDQLERARQGPSPWRNLVVSATGTGKTLVAAFDYRRLQRRHGELTLLFLAHRQEILEQARHQFRNVLRDGNFGELWVGGERPVAWRHVLASIQSAAAGGSLPFRPDQFDVVVLDEMHHAPAPSYEGLLERLQPRLLLLGLSATPERSDGQNAARQFGGRISAELRLWDALKQQLLAPFHYFGVPDDVDLSQVEWRRGSYAEAELEARYVGAEGRNRVAKILEALNRYLADPSRLRALGFCVGVAHAEFMARCFTEAGLPSRAISGRSSAPERQDAIAALRSGAVRVLFTVDLFNEGVDLPEVDTLLFLRPTESATLFMQQLGRGLRLCEGKSCVTVLDFIGNQNRSFRFDLRYRALLGVTRRQLQEGVEQGFPVLPPGCDFRLEPAAKEAVLRNLRDAVQAATTARLSEELRRLGNPTLEEFLTETGLDPEELYRGGRTLTSLRRRAKLLPAAGPEGEAGSERGLERLLGQNDPKWFGLCREGLGRPAPPQPESLRELRQWRMLLATVLAPEVGNLPDPAEALEFLWKLTDLRAELAELLQLLATRGREVTTGLREPEWADVPLCLHGAYSRNAVATAFRLPRPDALREGVRWFPEQRTDVFFVTFRKSDAQFSPTTRYDDYVISPTELHWESQSTTRADSPTGRRYRNHTAEGSHVLVFGREQKERDGRTEPFFCLGPATYVSHESERPMRIRWRLQAPLPERVFERFRAASG